MAYTALDVKNLRDKTGLGMMDCKNALEINNGDIDLATDYLRKKGLAAATNKSTRIASEGIIDSYIHPGNRVGVIIEVNCETDFVARTDNFKYLVHTIAMHIAAHDPTPQFISRDDVTETFLAREKNIASEQALATGKPANVIEKIVAGKINKIFEEVCLLEQKFIMNNEITVGEHISLETAKIGEKIKIRRFNKYTLGQ